MKLLDRLKKRKIDENIRERMTWQVLRRNLKQSYTSYKMTDENNNLEEI